MSHRLREKLTQPTLSPPTDILKLLSFCWNWVRRWTIVSQPKNSTPGLLSVMSHYVWLSKTSITWVSPLLRRNHAFVNCSHSLRMSRDCYWNMAPMGTNVIFSVLRSAWLTILSLWSSCWNMVLKLRRETALVWLRWCAQHDTVAALNKYCCCWVIVLTWTPCPMPETIIEPFSTTPSSQETFSWCSCSSSKEPRSINTHHFQRLTNQAHCIWRFYEVIQL